MCPNKNHPDWKALEATYGTTQAFRYWMAGLDSQSKVDDYIQPKVADESFMQLDIQKEINPAIEALDNYLLDFLKAFNVKTKQFDELKSRLGVNALGATDVLNKLIWYVKNRNEETIPEEAAHMLVALMGINHPDIEELIEKCQELYFEGNLQKSIELFEENESTVQTEILDKNLKIQFYVSYIATLVVTILMENRSFDEIERRIFDCKELIKDKKSLEFARVTLQHAIAWDYKPISSSEEKEENLDKAIKLIDEVIVILEKLENTKYLSQAYFYRGLFFERRRQFYIESLLRK